MDLSASGSHKRSYLHYLCDARYNTWMSLLAPDMNHNIDFQSDLTSLTLLAVKSGSTKRHWLTVTVKSKSTHCTWLTVTVKLESAALIWLTVAVAVAVNLVSLSHHHNNGFGGQETPRSAIPSTWGACPTSHHADSWCVSQSQSKLNVKLKCVSMSQWLCKDDILLSHNHSHRSLSDSWVRVSQESKPISDFDSQSRVWFWFMLGLLHCTLQLV